MCYVISSVAWPQIRIEQMKTNIVTFRQKSVAFCPGTCGVSEFLLWFVSLIFVVLLQSNFNTPRDEIRPDYV